MEMREIFARQRELQDNIYANCGMRDRNGQTLTIASVAAEAQAGRWGVNDLPNRSLIEMERAMRDELDELKACLPWKHWSKERVAQREYPDQPQHVRVAEVAIEIIDMFHFLVNMWLSLGLDEKHFAAVYEEKRRMNEERQAAGYNAAGKSNADNDRLSVRIAPILYPDHATWT